MRTSSTSRGDGANQEQMRETEKPGLSSLTFSKGQDETQVPLRHNPNRQTLKCKGSMIHRRLPGRALPKKYFSFPRPHASPATGSFPHSSLEAVLRIWELHLGKLDFLLVSRKLRLPGRQQSSKNPAGACGDSAWYELLGETKGKLSRTIGSVYSPGVYPWDARRRSYPQKLPLPLLISVLHSAPAIPCAMASLSVNPGSPRTRVSMSIIRSC